MSSAASGPEADRWRRIDALFEELLEKSGAEREAFLARQGSELRRELEKLIDADEAARTFLEGRAGSWLELTAMTPLPEAATEALPRRIGQYKILGVLGEGGMGRVLLAARADQQYQRLVAIKTLRSRPAAKLRDPRADEERRSELLARFDLERQALAQLEHPNIARLYDAGRDESGDPYLVLEHVDGVPIDTYCDQQQLGVEARLRLFLEVCQAVQAAHRNLLVHRDLKPSNILVTREGRPMLLDFGIAKLLDPARVAGELLETREGSRPMTPGYASPEQVKGEPITTASDVYSLGVLLYELLTGRKPYRVTSWLPHELEKAICEVPPEKPSTAVFRDPAPPDARGGQSLQPAELARRRGTSPGALARHLRGDLDRLLEKALRKDPDRRYVSVEALAQDIEAYLDGRPLKARPAERLYAFRKFVARHRAGATAVALLAILLIAFTGALMIQAEEIRAEGDKARQALAFLVEVFKASDPTRAQGQELMARDILDGAALRVENELAGQPEIQATLMDAMGQVYASLGHLPEARDLYAKALPLRVALRGESDRETLATRGRLGGVLVGVWDSAEARRQLEKALADRPEDAPEDEDLADLLTSLAALENNENQTEKAVELQRRAAAVLERIGAGFQQRLAAKARLVRALIEDHRFQELDPLLAELRRETDGLTEGPAESASLETGTTLLEVADQLWEFGDDRAEELMRRGIAILRRTVGEKHPRYTFAMMRLAFVLDFEKRYQEALAIDEDAYQTVSALLGPDHEQVVELESNLAVGLGRLGRLDEALGHFRHVGQRLIEIHGPQGSRLFGFYLAECGLNRERGDFAAAEKSLQAARRILAVSDSKMLDPAGAELYTARLRRAQKSGEMALTYFARGLEMRRQGRGEDDWRYTYFRSEYAELLAEMGRFEEAEAEAKASYDSLRRNYGPRTLMVKEPLRVLAAIYQKTGRGEEAERMQAALADPAKRPAKL